MNLFREKLFYFSECRFDLNVKSPNSELLQRQIIRPVYQITEIPLFTIAAEILQALDNSNSSLVASSFIISLVEAANDS